MTRPPSNSERHEMLLKYTEEFIAINAKRSGRTLTNTDRDEYRAPLEKYGVCSFKEQK